VAGHDPKDFASYSPQVSGVAGWLGDSPKTLNERIKSVHFWEWREIQLSEKQVVGKVAWS